MDYSKIFPIADIIPEVHIANYLDERGSVFWGPRTLADYELILIRAGRFVYESETAGRLACEQGDVLIIPPGERHVLCSPDGEWAFSCIHAVPHPGFPSTSDTRVLDVVVLDPDPRGVVRFSDGYSYMDSLFHRCSDTFNGVSTYSRELAGTFCREIWLRCAARHSGGAASGDLRMKAMLRYIRQHIDCSMDRNRLADAFGLSPGYVNALFKKEFGMSTSATIHREKVVHGYALLHNRGYTVSEAAYACGFSDPFYFSRMFKRVLGITPDAVRSRRR